jgi:hypothetical protein
MIFNASAT